MATLADINETLLAQNQNLTDIAEESKETSDSIQSLVQRISADQELQERQRLKDTTKKAIKPVGAGTGQMMSTMSDKYSEAPSDFMGGLFKGLGLGAIGAGGLGIAAFVGGILSKVLGLIGTGAGKFIKTGALIGLVSAFGEDVINAIFGDGLTDAAKAGMKEALYATATFVGLGGKLITGLLSGAVAFLFPETSAAVGGGLVEGFKTALDAIGLKSDWIDTAMGEHSAIIQSTLGAMAVAMVGRAVLLFGGKKILGLLTKRIMTGVGLTAAIKLALDKLLPAGGAPDIPTPGGSPSADPRAGRYAQQGAGARARAAKVAADLAKNAPASKLPPGFDRNKAGALINADTKKFASVDDLAEAILKEKGAKAAKYAKFLKVAGPLGALVDLVDPLMAIYTDQPEDVVKKELAGSLGSVSGAYLGAVAGAGLTTLIPVVGQSGIGNAIGGLFGAVAGSMAGEYTAESLANFLLGGPTPKKVDTPARDLAEEAVMGQSLQAPTETQMYGMSAQGFVAASQSRAAIAAENEARDLQSVPSVMLPKPKSMVARPPATAKEITEYLMQQDYQSSQPAAQPRVSPAIVDQSVNTTNNRAGDTFAFASGGVGNGVDRTDGRYSTGRGGGGLQQ